MRLQAHSPVATTLRDKLSYTHSTHSAEVLLVLTDSLHLRSVQHRHIVGHGLLCFLFVLFLEAQTERGLTFEHIYRLDLIFPRTGSVKYLADDVPHLLSVDDVRGVDDGRVAGPVHLSSLLVLSLEKWIPKNHRFVF